MDYKNIPEANFCHKEYEPVINWVDHKELPKSTVRIRNAHRDPTANMAISNVMEEQRRKNARKPDGKKGTDHA